MGSVGSGSDHGVMGIWATTRGMSLGVGPNQRVARWGPMGPKKIGVKFDDKMGHLVWGGFGVIGRRGAGEAGAEGRGVAPVDVRFAGMSVQVWILKLLGVPSPA